MLLDVLDAEQPREKEREREEEFFFRVFFFFFFSDEVVESGAYSSWSWKESTSKKTNLSLLDDVVGLGEHLEQGDLAQGRRGDALFLHLFFILFFYFFSSVEVEVERQGKRPPRVAAAAAARFLEQLSLSLSLSPPFPICSACLSLSF